MPIGCRKQVEEVGCGPEFTSVMGSGQMMLQTEGCPRRDGPMKPGCFGTARRPEKCQVASSNREQMQERGSPSK